MIYDHLGINQQEHLTIGGVDTTYLAEKYGTPLYVMDENRIRKNCKTYIEALRENFSEGSVPLFAGKALCFKRIYRILQEEGMSADVVSSGELYTAMSAGFPPQRLYFHGNNKTDEDIRYGVDCGIGYFVVDNCNELNALDDYAKEKGIVQKVILRVTPGIDSHTLKAINTGRIDCQFGNPIETGQALEFVKYALEKKNIDILGFHSHIGSQIFNVKPFCDAVDIILDFAGKVKDRLGFTARIFNLGGGFAVRYLETDPHVDISGNIKLLAKHLKDGCKALDYPVPIVLMEPGRSIVADAGITLYTAGGIKPIEGYRNYVTVDGGMTDNPRYALYKSNYTVLMANKMKDVSDFTCSVAGRCCESGDLIQENINLPKPKRGDLLAVLTTGAYNFAMAMNYNRVCRPPVVMIKDGVDYPAVRRQTFEDIVACDL